MTLKVAFDARSLVSPTPRGWDRYLLELIARLPRVGVDPWLIYEEGKPISRAHTLPSECQLLGVNASRGLAWEQVALPRALSQLSFDVYHAPAERGVPFAAPCPVVLTLHSLTHHSYQAFIRDGLLPGQIGDYLDHASLRPSFRSFYAEAQYRAADHVLVPSEFCRDELLSLLQLPASKVTVTRLGLPEVFRSAPVGVRVSATLERFGIEQPYVLYVGGYERHKNVVGLLEVIERARGRMNNLSFVLVGTGDVPELLKRSAGASNRVHFLNNLTDALVPLYDGASAMLTMSWRESFCLPALEALSRGVPVVASRWGAAGEIVGETGALVDPRDPEQACAALLKMLSMPIDREALRNRALEFTWDAPVKRTFELYAELVDAWHGSARLRTIATRARGILQAGAGVFSGVMGDST